jgi:cytochrome c oxidase cbb3-type subunit 3
VELAGRAVGGGGAAEAAAPTSPALRGRLAGGGRGRPGAARLRHRRRPRRLGAETAPPATAATAPARLGFPNLRDRDWLWGGTPEAIRQTLQVGIRWPGEDETRSSQMPAFGAMRLLERPAIRRSWSTCGPLGAGSRRGRGARGAPVYAEQCAACHGERGEGNQELGAPRLSDDVWLYGGGREAIHASIWSSRAGVMPAFGGR